jgi:hypothetical protein
VSAYSSLILSETGLVSYWRLDESAGTSAADSKGTNTGAYTGGFTLGAAGGITSDPTDTAVGLDGATGYVAVPSNASLHPAQVTVEAWVNASAASPGSMIATGCQYPSVVGYALGFGQSTSTFLLGFGSYDGAHHIAVDPDGTFPTGAWFHVVGTYDGTNLKLYKNGVLKATTAYAGPLQYNATQFWIGKRWDVGGGRQFFAGTIDEVAVYNVALTSTQIAAHYAAGTAAGTTYTDSPTGSLTLTGSITETKTGADSQTGSLTLTGSLTQTLTRTGSPQGAFTLTGTATDARIGRDSPTGALVLIGSTGVIDATCTLADARVFRTRSPETVLWPCAVGDGSRTVLTLSDAPLNP